MNSNLKFSAATYERIEVSTKVLFLTLWRYYPLRRSVPILLTFSSTFDWSRLRNVDSLKTLQWQTQRTESKNGRGREKRYLTKNE
jgi:hypothetical protein